VKVAAAQFSDTVLTTQAFKDNADLFFCGVSPPGGAAYISKGLLGTGFIGFSWHYRFL